MSGMIAILLSILLTAMSWGFYGPVLHWGQDGMSGSRLLPFICVGISYFFIAILIPLYLLVVHTEKGEWTTKGIIWSLAAGALGAFGALGVVLALTNGGRPVYVMPLIFGGAPVVNTVVTMISTKTYRVQPLFLAGLVGVILGAGLVLTNKPLPAKGEAAEVLDWSGTMLVVSFVCLTALCWGSYGTFLHKGQALMKGSRMRPYMCVGISYFLIGVLVPMGLLQLDPNGIPAWTWEGAGWSLAAGCCGAFGALGIILAFTFGGRPIYVMPLVFSGAPVINTFVTIFTAAKLTTPSILFVLGLVCVVAGAVFVLVFAPKPGKAHATQPAQPTTDPAQAPAS